MTDDLMDERLRAAGQRWRAANPETSDGREPGEEFEILARPRRERPQRWVSAASAAVVAAALVVGGIVFAANRDNGRGAPAALPESASTLTGRAWALTGDPSSTLRIGRDGKVTGEDGCNSLVGSAKIDGNKITFAVGGTYKLCPPGSSGDKTERVLIGTVTWSVTGGVLILAKPGVGSLVYSSTSDLTLVGPRWRLTTIRDRVGKTIKVTDNDTFTISGEQKLTGTIVCNSISGDAEVRLDTVTFKNVATTEIGCTPAGGTGSASTAAAILAGTVPYAVHGDQLTLTKIGVGTLTYRAAAADVPSTDAAQLAGPAWTLSGVETTYGTSASGSSAASLSVVTFDDFGSFTVKHHCYTNQGKAVIGAGIGTLSDVTLKLAVPCASNAESKTGQDENDLVDLVLTGPITWSITGSELTISKPGGANTLTFTKR